jgi:hypothetical protein
MRRDAGTEVERHAVEMVAAACRAVAAALLQTVDVGISKIPATRTLREIAAKRRNMPNLRSIKALR